MDTAPRDGTTVIGRGARIGWKSDPPRTEGPFIASIKWKGGEWVLAEMFLEDAGADGQRVGSGDQV